MCIRDRVSYATKRGLTQPEDYDVARNKLLDLLQLDSCPPSEAPQPEALEEILKGLLDYACGQGLCQDHAAARDLFDSRLMGALTPFPREILAGFRARDAEDPASATSWYYQVCQDTNYIRRDRVAKQLHWTSRSPYEMCIRDSIIHRYPGTFAYLSQVKEVVGNFKHINKNGQQENRLLDDGSDGTL